MKRAKRLRQPQQPIVGCALSGPLEPLGDIRQRGGKRVTAFAVEGDLDAIKSNTSRSNGRQKAGGCHPFPRSTERLGSIYRSRT